MRIKCILFILTALLICGATYSQSADTAWKKIYRATPTKINDLLHTRLDVKFDYDKAWMYGKEWVTLHPHFYQTDSLHLDAKGMTINEVSLIKAGKKIPLKYLYDSTDLFITLNKTYKATEQYTIYIDYIVKPDYTKLPGTQGIFFINPKGENKNEPIQVWTQGEQESNSAWFPTIDKPNQKTTEEINMTVPEKFVSMSNGLLVKQKINGDGTRTDSWKMNEPNAPYLFFMGVGDYTIIKDKYKNKEVSYYVYKEFASTARRIFGVTPEEIAFFSKITGVDYPWEKYVQIVCENAGGFSMENTSCTMHSEYATADERDLTEINWIDAGIAHELFHQWFGDYVTCESWSNLTLNESFATLGETLWNEYKHGKDKGEATIYANLKTYLSSPDNIEMPLVHFYYDDKAGAANNITYAKGACILNMLRNYVGDSAFFKSLHVYLIKHQFGNAEAQDLRLAFEEVTGEDLNWFWNEWFYNSGHPKLDINYGYDAQTKTAKVFIKQTQAGDVFKFPFAVEVYEGANNKRYKVWMKNQSDTFSFPSNAKPLLVNVDADKELVCEKNDNKTLDEFIYQYIKGGNYVDRSEAIDFASAMQTNSKALNFLKTALHDKSSALKSYTLNKLNIENDTIRIAVEEVVKNLTNDSNAYVRADAINALSKNKNSKYESIYLKALTDSSYTVASNALQALSVIDSTTAENKAKELLTQPARGALKYTLYAYIAESKFDSLVANFNSMPIGNTKLFNLVPAFSKFLARIKNTDTFKKGVDVMVKFRDSIPQQFHVFTDPVINNALKETADKKMANGLKAESDYVQSKLPGESK
jgi:aminopeptidase N